MRISLNLSLPLDGTRGASCLTRQAVKGNFIGMNVVDLGLVGYQMALERQQAAVRAAQEGGPDTLFLLEHHPVITFGRNGGEENLPFDRAFFAARGVEIVRSSRGGNITCHFPGQLVAYPVLRIDGRPGGLRQLFHDLEESVIKTLSVFGLASGRVAGRPGVWVEGRKICSIGIAVERRVTSHGLAVNIFRDLNLFELVTPCGLAGIRATSLHRELNTETISMNAMKGAFATAFCEIFAPTQKVCHV